ncbi:LOW QUALITY PROTEIN: S-formylglutathione hydrolase-like [Octopus sinensis]|uniref:S-formylglutathione hydrolase n=1 Tax=Octopus sinensis TaxID=2607531 RepID=A0A7E6FUA5_9MOLL|nr:LOW QUALITY PROTEIN: S-formylglutathione hydrolase-like [Octopus sinensis]
MSNLEQVSSNKCFGGFQKVFKHSSSELKCEMKFGIYLPAKSEFGKLPVLYWLSGATCSEQNFITKSGFQRYAAEHNIIVVAPDTCPRAFYERKDDGYDLQKDVASYVDATQPKWSTNYRMYSYIVKELPKLIESNFPVLPEKKSISGHSMGGHGALTIALKNPTKYKSVSALSPVSNPILSHLSKEAFKEHLGENEDDWHEYDTCSLMRKNGSPFADILIDQGLADIFLKDVLLTENLEKVVREKNVAATIRKHEGYGHGYYFIASFIGDHIKYHAKFLNEASKY